MVGSRGGVNSRSDDSDPELRDIPNCALNSFKSTCFNNEGLDDERNALLSEPIY